MTQDGLMLVMTVAVVVSALALLAQAGFLLGLYRSTRSIREQITAFAPRAESLVDSAEQTLIQSRKQLTEVTSRANAVLESAQSQLARVDDVLADAAGRARVQMERVELVLDDTVSRLHETMRTLNNGVLRPIKELSGITAGLRAALSYLLGGSRTSVAQATSDEEMFI